MRVLGIDYGLRRTGLAIAEVDERPPHENPPHENDDVSRSSNSSSGDDTPGNAGPEHPNNLASQPHGGGGMALPFEMFEGLPDVQLAQAIADLVRREQVTQVVIGLPLNADGSVSQQSKLTERFILTLQQHVPPTVPVERVSEFLSTHHAEGKLAGHYTRQQKRQRVDALAAAGLLQDWLDQRYSR